MQRVTMCHEHEECNVRVLMHVLYMNQPKTMHVYQEAHIVMSSICIFSLERPNNILALHQNLLKYNCAKNKKWK